MGMEINPTVRHHQLIVYSIYLNFVPYLLIFVSFLLFEMTTGFIGTK